MKATDITPKTSHQRTVQEFDIKKYMGLWYEVARYDNIFERGLVDVKAKYTLMKDNTVKVENRGRNLYGKLNDIACDIVSFVACNEKVTAAQLSEKFGDGAKSCVASLIKQGYIEKRADSSFHENKKTTKL